MIITAIYIFQTDTCLRLQKRSVFKQAEYYLCIESASTSYRGCARPF